MCGDFSTWSGGTFYNELFNGIQLAGLLKAKHIHTVDNISPFTGAIVRVYCGEERSATVTHAFIHYVELLKPVCCGNGTIRWTDDDADVLKKANREGQKMWYWSVRRMSAVRYRNIEMRHSRPHLWSAKEANWISVYGYRPIRLHVCTI